MIRAPERLLCALLVIVAAVPVAAAGVGAGDDAEVATGSVRPRDVGWTADPFPTPRWVELHRRLHGVELEFESEYFRWKPARYQPYPGPRMGGPYDSALFRLRAALSGYSGFGGWFQMPFYASNHPTGYENVDPSRSFTYRPVGSVGGDHGVPAAGLQYTWKTLKPGKEVDLGIAVTAGFAAYGLQYAQVTDNPSDYHEENRLNSVGLTRFMLGPYEGTRVVLEPNLSFALDWWRFAFQLDLSYPIGVEFFDVFRLCTGVGLLQPLGFLDSQLVLQAEGTLMLVDKAVRWTTVGAMVDLQLPVFRIGAGTRLVIEPDEDPIPTLVVRVGFSGGPTGPLHWSRAVGSWVKDPEAE